MTMAEWRFSAHLAWQDGFVRWITLLSAAFGVFTSGFVLWRLLPNAIRTGSLTMHYTIYLGIDDVRNWPWVFLVPALIVTVLVVNSLVAFAIYRSDALASRAVVGLTAALTFIATVGSFFLVLINV